MTSIRPLVAAGACLLATTALSFSLVPVSSYDTGLGGNGAEIVSVRRDGLAALTNIAGSVDLVDVSNPAAPMLVRRVAVGPGVPNSVALHPQHDYFLVVTGSAGATGRVQAWSFGGTLLHEDSVGIQPDSIGIAADGSVAVVANEAEGAGTGNAGGEGSISLIDLEGFNGKPGRSFEVTNLALPSLNGASGFSTGRTDDIARLAIDNSPPTLEPESVAFSPDLRYAWVTLQENSGAARLDLQTGNLAFFGFGRTTHAADLTPDGTYAPTGSLDLYRESDGIGVTQDGRFVVTADEGDTRTGTGSSGPRGGRTVSVFDAATGAFIADTGNQLDDAAAAAGLYPDARSNRGGSEPEVLAITSWRGSELVAVGLERANAVALVDVSDPAAPTVTAIRQVGLAPEGVQFWRRGSELYVLVAEEASGTMSVLRVEP